jgi:hypothetical protein
MPRKAYNVHRVRGSTMADLTWFRKCFEECMANLYSGNTEYVGNGSDALVGWNDLISDISIRGVGANDPTPSLFRGFYRSYEFSASTMNECFISFHIHHDYKPGSPIYIHIHYSPNTTASSGVVRWGFEYTIAKGHQQSQFGATSTLYVNQTVDTQYRHYIAEIADPGISSSELEVDSLVLCRIFRDAANAADTYTGTVHVFFCDVHYQANRLYTKNRAPNFYQ